MSLDRSPAVNSSPINARAAILQALFDGPGSCPDLIERLEGASQGRVRLRQGPASLALRSLQRDGLVRGWTVSSRGRRGRPRRYYELTFLGIEVATTERDALRGLLGRTARPRARSVAQRRAMSERLASAIALSDFALTLRDAPRRPMP